jgi:hypothetical protein
VCGVAKNGGEDGLASLYIVRHRAVSAGSSYVWSGRDAKGRKQASGWTMHAPCALVPVPFFFSKCPFTVYSV